MTKETRIIYYTKVAWSYQRLSYTHNKLLFMCSARWHISCLLHSTCELLRHASEAERLRRGQIESSSRGTNNKLTLEHIAKSRLESVESTPAQSSSVMLIFIVLSVTFARKEDGKDAQMSHFILSTQWDIKHIIKIAQWGKTAEEPKKVATFYGEK